MESELNKRMKSNSLRERLKKKQEEQKMTKILQEAANEMTGKNENSEISENSGPSTSDEDIISLFSSKDNTEKKKKKKKNSLYQNLGQI